MSKSKDNKKTQNDKAEKPIKQRFDMYPIFSQFDLWLAVIFVFALLLLLLFLKFGMPAVV